jgi:hypothetical protein
MKPIRAIAALAVTIFVFSQAVAMAGASSREAHYDFDLTKPGPTAWFGADYGIFFGDAVTIPVPDSAHSVDLTVVDDSASQVSVAVWQGDSEPTVFCGIAGMLPVTGGQPLNLQVILAVTPGSGCAAPELPTQGTITATFGHHGRGGHQHLHHHH